MRQYTYLVTIRLPPLVATVTITKQHDRAKERTSFAGLRSPRRRSASMSLLRLTDRPFQRVGSLLAWSAQRVSSRRRRAPRWPLLSAGHGRIAGERLRQERADRPPP